MNMLDTSIIAYEKVQPKINKRQRQILQVFWMHPTYNYTNMELAKMLGWSINRVTPRVKELRDRGRLKKASRRVCTVTGNLAYGWKLV